MVYETLSAFFMVEVTFTFAELDDWNFTADDDLCLHSTRVFESNFVTL